MIYGAPPWAWGLILSQPFIIWMLIEYIVRLRRQLVPKIDLVFDGDGGGVVSTREETRVDVYVPSAERLREITKIASQVLKSATETKDAKKMAAFILTIKQ